MNELAAKISASEVEVLEVLWQADAPMPIAAIRAALEGGHQWDASTVKTLLRRLCEKGAVEAEKREVFYYRPVLTRQEYQAWSTSSLIDKVYRGSAKDLVAALVERSPAQRPGPGGPAVHPVPGGGRPWVKNFWPPCSPVPVRRLPDGAGGGAGPPAAGQKPARRPAAHVAAGAVPAAVPLEHLRGDCWTGGRRSCARRRPPSTPPRRWRRSPPTPRRPMRFWNTRKRGDRSIWRRASPPCGRRAFSGRWRAGGSPTAGCAGV